MADRYKDRPQRLRAYSKRFEEFVDNELDGDISDLDITDDEDADPDFQLHEINRIEAEQPSSSEDENDNGNDSSSVPNLSEPVTPQPTSTAYAVSQSRPTVSSSPVSSLELYGAPNRASDRTAVQTVSRTSISPRASGAVLSKTRHSPRALGSPAAPPDTAAADQVIQPCEPPSDRLRVFWKKQLSFEPLPAAPTHEERPINPLNLPPQDYVSKYIPEDIFHLFTENTNRSYIEKKGRSLISNNEQTKKSFGASIKMSIMGLPRTRMYYDSKTKVPSIASILPRDQFFAIRSNLKVVYDNEVTPEEKAASKFWKVNPLKNSVRTGCLLNDRTANVAIDEQMVPFWGHCPARQVIKSKPNPCGIKIFVAAAPDGLPLDFFFYNGKGDPIAEEPLFNNLTIGGKAVIKLLRTFPKGVSVYMDRYFTSEYLMDMLHSEAEASGTGTLQIQRVPKNCKLKEDKELQKNGRGSIDMSVRSDGQVCLTKWFDNKPVLMISNKEGAYPTDKCKRWCKITKRFIEVERPLVVKHYNTYMGGVDFLDRVISYYRIATRTRKWTVRVIMHFFDFAIAAGWIEYRRDQRALHTPKREIMDLMKFKDEYADFLIHGGIQDQSDDTDSDYGSSIPPPRKQPRVAHPPDVLRTKNVLHLPEIPTPPSKNRCRFPGCSSNGARIRCTTCKVFLCVQEKRNCFKDYHEL